MAPIRWQGTGPGGRARTSKGFWGERSQVPLTVMLQGWGTCNQRDFGARGGTTPGIKALNQRTEKGSSRAQARNPLATSLPPQYRPELGMGREVS